MGKLQTIITLAKHYGSFLDYDLTRIYLKNTGGNTKSTMEHIEAAVKWICTAQDTFHDDGVSRSYSFIYNSYFKRKGWYASYPETTGYIIPTMFDYAKMTDDQDIFNRAVRMAEWECDVQMENGAVQGGTIGQELSPAIFNTGQVIFGWVRAYKETGEEKFLDAAVRAGRYLVNQQDEDGSWRKNLSSFASLTMEFYTYNTRTAWALLQLSTVVDDHNFRDSAIRNIEFGLTQQLDNGWFKHNCLSDPSQPLLHTIAYCIRGILESGMLTDNQNYIDRTRKAADALIEKQRSDGSLAGRFNDKWEPTVSWSCLTGDAQISIIWGKLYKISGETRYLNAMKAVNKYLKGMQLLETDNQDIYGGITGSWPVHGDYGTFEILNWAVKFYLDALMLEMSIRDSRK